MTISHLTRAVHVSGIRSVPVLPTFIASEGDAHLQVTEATPWGRVKSISGFTWSSQVLMCTYLDSQHSNLLSATPLALQVLMLF